MSKDRQDPEVWLFFQKNLVVLRSICKDCGEFYEKELGGSGIDIEDTVAAGNSMASIGKCYKCLTKRN